MLRARDVALASIGTASRLSSSRVMRPGTACARRRSCAVAALKKMCSCVLGSAASSVCASSAKRVLVWSVGAVDPPDVAFDAQ